MRFSLAKEARRIGVEFYTLAGKKEISLNVALWFPSWKGALLPLHDSKGIWLPVTSLREVPLAQTSK